MRLIRVLLGAAVVFLPVSAAAQSFDAAGTRAAGMGGAFVAVADDASAVFWNPAGLAFGAAFSFVSDRRDGETQPDTGNRAGDRSSFLSAVGTPALGLSHYRLRTTSLTALSIDGPDGSAVPSGQVRLDTLITHQTGFTLVQSILRSVAVGATLKLVRGVASTAIAVDGDREALLEGAADLDGESTTKFDLDAGVMAHVGSLKAGLTFRNLTEPSFDTPGNQRRLTLGRQARAGVAFSSNKVFLVAADYDVMKTEGALGQEQVFALGGEVHVLRRAAVRAGLHLNTVSGSSDDTTYTFGGSYTIKRAFMVDAQINSGSDRTEHGWGLAARFVY